MIGRERPVVEVATAFVLKDDSGRELDFHVVRFDEYGRGMPAWDSEFVFPTEAFSGPGSRRQYKGAMFVGGDADAHPHRLRASGDDVHDLRLLHERFGIDYPMRSQISCRLGRHRPRGDGVKHANFALI
jgi:hypothetical protein